MADVLSRVGSRLCKFAGLDFHVAVTLLFRSWGIVAGGIMVLTIPATLSPQHQGYYFTFSSLLGLQIFFELGLNQVVVQLVSHESAFVSRDSAGRLQGEPLHIDRLTSIIQLLRRWYAVAALLFAVVTGAVGAALFHKGDALTPAQWLGPWLLLVGMTALNLYLSPMLAVIEGCGAVGQVARIRLVQSMLGYGMTWAVLFSGGGLWAIAFIAGIGAACTWWWLRRSDHPLSALDTSLPVPRERAVDWRREVLPFQWRIAVSWVSGYLIFQLSVPMVFANLGPVTAGRLGMSVAIFSALFSVGISWINATVPAMTSHISRNERAELDRKFFAVLARSMVFTFVTSALLLSVCFVLGQHGFKSVERVADLPTMICIAVQNLLTTGVYGAATYMRAHRKEPMLPVSVVGGLVTLGGIYYASRLGIFETMLLQVLVTLLITVPWTWVLFRRYRAAERNGQP